MVLTSSTASNLSAEDRTTLLMVARRSIEFGLRHGRALALLPADYPETLQVVRATFVTLEAEQRLRGCVGALEARLRLVEDVAEHAFAAAFSDPRFPALGHDELSGLDIHISVLSSSEPIRFRSESELLTQLRPGIDGLILRLGERRATFLPAVWDSLPNPDFFWAHLKQKAGLTPDYWSDELVVERYTTESFGAAAALH